MNTRSLAAFLVALALPALGAPGDLDGSFGTGGRVDFTVAGQFGEARAVRIAGDKAVVLMHLRGSIAPRLALARFLADGSPDSAFGSGGQVRSSLDDSASDASEISDARSLLLQPDGSVVVGGEGNISGTRSPVLMRFTPDGVADASFGTAGRRIAVAGASSGAVHSLVRLADGKLLAAGVAVFGSTTTAQIFVTRLTAEGLPDSAFGSAGVTRIADATERVRIALQGDGRIVVGAMTLGVAMWARRLMPDGSADTTFGTNGRVDMAGASDIAQALVQANGRVTLVGNSSTFVRGLCSARGTNVGLAVIGRVDASGNTGNTMAGGVLKTSRGPYPRIQAATLDAQERLVVAGSRFVGCGVTFTIVEGPMLMRFTAAGALDTEFGSNGVATLGLSSSGSNIPRDVAVMDDGRMVAVGDGFGGFSLFRVLGGDSAAIASVIGDVDNDGAPDAVESGDPFVRDNDIFGDARLFAMQQYRDFLAREGDSGGVDFWANQLASGARTRAQVIESFFGSAEFQAAMAPVARLYFAYFLRVPDYGGITFWSQYYGANSLAAISNYFAGSQEFIERYGSLDHAAFVTRVYNNVLGRAPDPDGQSFWTSQLESGAMTRGQVMLAFSESPEYQSLTRNEVYVTMMYIGMLRRAPDPGGFSFWVDSIDRGTNGLALINGFLGSPEYRARFLPY